MREGGVLTGCSYMRRMKELSKRKLEAAEE